MEQRPPTAAGGGAPRSSDDRPEGARRRFATTFEPVSVLGVGAYGVVHLARHRASGLLYAVKRIPLWRGATNERALAEARTLAALPPHEHVVRFHDSWCVLLSFFGCYPWDSLLGCSSLFHG